MNAPTTHCEEGQAGAIPIQHLIFRVVKLSVPTTSRHMKASLVLCACCCLVKPTTSLNSAKPLQRVRRVANVDEIGDSATLDLRRYLTACLFEDLGENSRRPRWQLSAGSKDARPFLLSDKCAHHSYHYAYSRYLMPLADRFVRGELRHASVLEIGLGCGQNNVGAGVRMWNSLFANATEGRRLQLHVLEYDPKCARLWQARWERHFQHLNLTIFTGDQANASTLEWVASHGSGGNLHRANLRGAVAEDHGASAPSSTTGYYDAIVDDGGHSMEQQQTSLAVLFKHVAPGGWYAVEDLQTSYDPKLGGRATGGGRRGHAASRSRSTNTTSTTELLGEMIGWMSGGAEPVVYQDARSRDGSGEPLALRIGGMLPLVEHIDCFAEICVLSRYA